MGDTSVGQASTIQPLASQPLQLPAVPRLPHLHLFRPQVDWPLRYGGPPFAVNLDKEFNIPAKEQRLSTPAAMESAQRVQQRPKAIYPHPTMVPSTPLEAPVEPPASGNPTRIPLNQVPSQPPPLAQAPPPLLPKPAGLPTDSAQPLPGAQVRRNPSNGRALASWTSLPKLA